jgi:putative acetyltransferase
MKIRMEKNSDSQGVHEVNLCAFPSNNEALLVEKLRKSREIISLIAIEHDKIVGHVLFSNATIENSDESFSVLVLAPVAVLPEFQNQGIGTQLIKNGIKKARKRGYSLVTVLGHPNYYPRFGFKPAKEHGIESPFNVPEDAFMVLELIPGTLNHINGVLKYPNAFDDIL